MKINEMSLGENRKVMENDIYIAKRESVQEIFVETESTGTSA